MSGDAAPQVRGPGRVGAGGDRHGSGAMPRLAGAMLGGLVVATLAAMAPRFTGTGPAAGVAGATAVAASASFSVTAGPTGVRPGRFVPEATVAILPATVSEVAALPPAPADPSRRLRVPVLGFHRILAHPDGAAPDYELATAQFAAILAGLASAGWHTITAEQLAWDLSADTPPPLRTFVITIDDGTDDGASDALPAMLRSGAVGTFFVIASRVGTAGYLSWDQLRAMRDLGMEIGNHTTTHPHLPDLSLDDAVSEILTCQVAISSRLGIRSRTLAYPYGAVSDATIRAARMSGIVAAFTTAEGQHASWAERLALPRINVGAAWTPARIVELLEDYIREPTPAPRKH